MWIGREIRKFLCTKSEICKICVFHHDSFLSVENHWIRCAAAAVSNPFRSARDSIMCLPPSRSPHCLETSYQSRDKAPKDRILKGVVVFSPNFHSLLLYIYIHIFIKLFYYVYWGWWKKNCAKKCSVNYHRIILAAAVIFPRDSRTDFVMTTVVVVYSMWYTHVMMYCTKSAKLIMGSGNGKSIILSTCNYFYILFFQQAVQCLTARCPCNICISITWKSLENHFISKKFSVTSNV